MKVSNYKIDSFIENPPLSNVLFFIHGNDFGYISYCKDKLLSSLMRLNNDNLTCEKIDAKETSIDKTFLQNIFNQPSLFEEGKVVVITNGQEMITPLLSILDDLENNLNEKRYLIVCANNYYPQSAKICQKIIASKNFAQISCFYNQAEEMQKIIKTQLLANKIKITNEALSYLTSVYELDRLANQGEITKIILYCLDNRSPTNLIELKDVEKITPRSLEGRIDRLFDAVVLADISTIKTELDNIFNQDIQPTFIIRALIYNIIRLLELKDLILQHKDKAKAINMLSPPVHFTRKNEVLHQVTHYSKSELLEIYLRLIDEEILVKTSGINPKLSVTKMLLDLCLIAKANQTKVA